MCKWIKDEGSHTSYVKVPPEEPGWCRVALEIDPFAESIQTARGPFSEKERILPTTSCKYMIDHGQEHLLNTNREAGGKQHESHGKMGIYYLPCSNGDNMGRKAPSS